MPTKSLQRYRDKLLEGNKTLEVKVFLSFVFAVVVKLVFNVIALAPMWTDQRFQALRLGGHVMSRHFRYYIPEFSGQIVVQTPVVVR